MSRPRGMTGKMSVAVFISRLPEATRYTQETSSLGYVRFGSNFALPLNVCNDLDRVFLIIARIACSRGFRAPHSDVTCSSTHELSIG